MLMCMTYTTSQDEKAMLRVFMRLQVNDTGFEMPIYVTYAFKCVRLQVNNVGQPYPTPCLQRRELDSLSDYSFYVRSFLTRAALHAARSTKALY